MKNKFVGIKEFQAKLSNSFPQKGEITTITKRNIPAYQISNLDGTTFSAAVADSNVKIDLGEGKCPYCGQPLKGVNRK